MYGLACFFLHGKTIRLPRSAVGLGSRYRAGVFGERHVETHPDERDVGAAQFARRAHEGVRQPLVRVIAISGALGSADVALQTETGWSASEKHGLPLKRAAAIERSRLHGERRVRRRNRAK